MAQNYIPSERKLKERHQPPPKITIAEMLAIAEGRYAETGHYPSFGEVRNEIDMGRIDPKMYIEKK